jgi:hypothetical protein
MLTFTKRGKFDSLDELWRSWREFNRLAEKRFGAQWGTYVAVPETHADGSWHLHVAVKGFFWAPTLNFLWNRALGGRGNERGSATLGNVDCKDRRSASARSTAGYMAKYVGKGFADVAGCRRLFAASKGVRALKEFTAHFPYWMTHAERVSAVQDYLRRVSGVPDWEVHCFGEGEFVAFVFETPLKDWRVRARVAA